MRTVVCYILIIFTIFMAIRYVDKSHNPESIYFNKGYGSKSDDLATLLERCNWANHYKGRLPIFWRQLCYAFIVTFIILLISTNSIPTPRIYIQCVFVSWMILNALNQYVQHHCEKFSHYAIDRNINLIRKKLKVKKVPIVPVLEKFPGASSCWNFVYKSDI